MKIKAIIIDDEPKNRKLLQQILAEYCPTIEVVALVESVIDGIPLIKNKAPQLVFLDIELSNHKTGFDFFDAFPVADQNFEVIFVTAHEQYMRTAFNKTYAIGYILKPIDPDELTAVVFKAKQRLLARQKSIPLIDDGIHLSDLLYCYIKDDVIRVKLVDGTERISNKLSLQYFEDITGMVRTNRQFIVNIQFISKIISYNEVGERTRNAGAILYNGDIIPISVTNRSKIIKLVS